MRSFSLAGFFSLLTLLPGLAHAHVKWFVDYDITHAPKAFGQILTMPFFWALGMLSVIVITAALMTEEKLAYPAFLKKIDLRAGPFAPYIVRYGLAIFALILAWGFPHLMLTPELHTNNDMIRYLMLLIACTAIFRRTAAVAGIAILMVYFFAMANYGAYHLLDYTIFIGIGIFLIAQSFPHLIHEVSAFVILRAFTCFTLMWGAIEKFAHPHMTYTLLEDHPHLTFGFDQEFFLLAAGFVEFCCAFLILFSNLCGKAGTLILLVFFIAAIIPFGMIDAVGHTPFLISLVALLLHRCSTMENTCKKMVSVGFPAAFLGMFVIYYGSFTLLVS